MPVKVAPVIDVADGMAKSSADSISILPVVPGRLAMPIALLASPVLNSTWSADARAAIHATTATVAARRKQARMLWLLSSEDHLRIDQPSRSPRGCQSRRSGADLVSDPLWVGLGVLATG